MISHKIAVLYEVFFVLCLSLPGVLIFSLARRSLLRVHRSDLPFAFILVLLSFLFLCFPSLSLPFFFLPPTDSSVVFLSLSWGIVFVVYRLAFFTSGGISFFILSLLSSRPRTGSATFVGVCKVGP